MRRDDVKHALDALASEVPAPEHDVNAVITRGRKRRTQRRLAFAGIAAALIAAVAIVTTIAHTNQSTPIVSPGPTTSTTAGYDVPVLGVPATQISVASAQEAWKCTDPLQYTSDGGRTWRDFALPVGAQVGGVFCTARPGGNVTAAWADGGVWHGLHIRDAARTQDISLPTVPNTDTVFPLTFVDPSHGWFEFGPIDGDTELYRTNDGGLIWELASHDRPLGPLAFVNASKGWTRRGNTLYATTDGGSSWRAVALPAPPHPAGVRVDRFDLVVRGNSVIVSGGIPIGELRDRTFFDVSTDGGKTWALRAGPAGFEVPHAFDNSFTAADGAHWDLVSGTTFRVSSDGGRTWQDRPKVPGVNGNSSAAWMISFPTANIGWATSEEGRTWRTTDSGRTWVEVTRGLAAAPPGPRPLAPPVPPPLPATGPVQSSFTITASPTGRLTFAPSSVSVDTGIYAVTLVDGSDVSHTLYFDEPSTRWRGLQVTHRGQRKTSRIFFGRAGDYTFYCALPGHRTAGMQGVVHISGPALTLAQAEGAATAANK